MTDLLNTTVRAPHRMSLIATALIAVAFGVAASPNMAAAGQSVATAPADGVIRTQSAYPFEETVDRLKSDIAAKGIRFFRSFLTAFSPPDREHRVAILFDTRSAP